jgi:hypothetical protein
MFMNQQFCSHMLPWPPVSSLLLLLLLPLTAPQDRYMVPAMLFAAHLSGSGADSVFVALLRPHLPDPGSVEVWCAPNTGAVMVTDSRVGDFLGYSVQEVSGQPIGKFVSSPEFEK